MATVIDSLVVRLGLDSTDFKKGQADTGKALKDTGKAADKTARDLQDSGKRAAEFFTSLTGAALKFFAVLSAGRGLADFTRSTIQGGAEVNRLARNLGMAASTISQWSNAVEVAGGNAGDFQSTVKLLSNTITDAKLGNYSSPMAQGLIRLGVAMSDGTGKARKLDDILNDIGDKALQKIPGRADQANILGNMGIAEGMVNLLLKTRQERAAMLEEQRKGVALTDEQAKKSEEAAQKWAKVKQQLEANGRELIYKLMPAMEQLTQLMVKLSEVAVPFLVEAVDLFTQLDHATDGWSTKIIAGIALFRILGGPAILGGITSLATALVSVGAAAASTLTSLRGIAALGVSFGGGYAAGTWLNGKITEKLTERNGGKETTLGTWLYDLLHPDEAGAATGATPKRVPGSAVPRSIRNNNPGNLEFRGQNGASLEQGANPRFAAFRTMAEGVAALIRQLQLYAGRGINSVRSIIGKFAPPGENNTEAYAQALAKRLGVDANAKLNLSDPKVVEALVRGISTVEAGREHLSAADLSGGMTLAGLGAAGRAGPAGGNNTTTVTVGQVTVNTQATDARGIARDLRGELVAQANTGMD